MPWAEAMSTWEQDASDNELSGADLTKVDQNIIRHYLSNLRKDSIPTEIVSVQSSIESRVMDNSGANMPSDWKE